MNNAKNNILPNLAIFSVMPFVLNFILGRMYGGMTKTLKTLGPCDLNEIPWMRDVLASIIIGVIFSLFAYIADKEMEKSKKSIGIDSYPRMKFDNFGTAILFFSLLFFGFIFLFAIREYFKRSLGITFFQFCSTQVPWLEILATSIIFGTILAIGFSKTPESEKKDDGNSNNQIADKEDKKE